MMRQQPRPARVTPPGRIIRRELEARGWTQKDLAAIMDRPEQAISEIINDKKQITAETARELGLAFGTSAEFWMNIEMNYRLHKADTGDGSSAIAGRRELYEAYPVRELIKRGWIKGTNNVKELAQELSDLLGTPDLAIVPAFALNLRQSQERGPQANAQWLWAGRVRQLAAGQKVGPFDLDRLKERIPDLLARSEDEAAIAYIPEALLELGVHFVYVPHLPHTYLDGAAFYLDGHPVVGLSMRLGRLDYFWFTLMHELGHIILGHKGTHLDQLYERDRAATTSSEAEEQANVWAADILLDAKAFQRFVQETQPRFSGAAIKAFAVAQRRHQAVVLGRLQYERLVEFSHLRSWLSNVRPQLAAWEDVSSP